MLHSMDSYEYAQWMAFERAYGPIGGEWGEEALAVAIEQLWQVSYLLGQAHFTDKTHRKGPVPKPERYPRPYEAPREALVSDDDSDEAEWLPPTEDELVEVHVDPGDEEVVGVEED